jgi:hypothetical protein
VIRDVPRLRRGDLPQWVVAQEARDSLQHCGRLSWESREIYLLRCSGAGALVRERLPEHLKPAMTVAYSGWRVASELLTAKSGTSFGDMLVLDFEEGKNDESELFPRRNSRIGRYDQPAARGDTQT